MQEAMANECGGKYGTIRIDPTGHWRFKRAVRDKFSTGKLMLLQKKQGMGNSLI
ncbi:hypothetical protein EI291_18865 [Hymenobacter rigui]|uniref:Uncharacterized protein n=1 Tax=Hymenobacter rigui TaxID=334424 RepID=A0A3R9MLP8_9BACT|nr:hypothetical protein EI291_18865 [Hymenobacter rigui]